MTSPGVIIGTWRVIASLPGTVDRHLGRRVLVGEEPAMDHRGEGELRARHQLTFRSSKSATAIVSADRRVDAIIADGRAGRDDRAGRGVRDRVARRTSRRSSPPPASASDGTRAAGRAEPHPAERDGVERTEGCRIRRRLSSSPRLSSYTTAAVCGSLTCQASPWTVAPASNGRKAGFESRSSSLSSKNCEVANSSCAGITTPPLAVIATVTGIARR